MSASPSPSNRPLGRFIPNPKLKFLDQCREVMRCKQFSHRTEPAYWHWIRGFMKFHRKPTPNPAKEGDHQGWRHPREMHAAEVQVYLSHLATEKNVASATQNQALNAIVFLDRDVLGIELGAIGQIERPVRRPKLPTVLTKEEVRQVLAVVAPEYQWPCHTNYL